MHIFFHCGDKSRLLCVLFKVDELMNLESSFKAALTVGGEVVRGRSLRGSRNYTYSYLRGRMMVHLRR